MALTGAGAGFGIPLLHAQQVAVNEINAHGGIKELGGAKLKLVVADSQSDPAVAGRLVRKMAGEGVSAFTGPELSSLAVANVPVIQRLHIPLFTSSIDDRVSENNAGYVFRTVNRASTFGLAGAHYLRDLETSKHTPISRIGIVGVNIPPGTPIDDALAGQAKNYGWQVTRIDYDPTTTKDYSPIVAKLKAANVQVVTGYQNPNDAIAFAKAMTAQDWRPQYGFVWVAGGQYLKTFKQALGSAVNGWIDVSFTGGLDTSKFSPQVQEYAHAYMDKPSADLGNAYAGAWVTLAADAIGKAKSRDPEKIAAAARTLSFASGQTGSEYPYWTQAGGLKFDANENNVDWSPTIVQLVGSGTGEQNVVYPPDLASAEVQWPEPSASGSGG